MDSLELRARNVAQSYLKEAGIKSLQDGWSAILMDEILTEDRGISVGVMYPGSHDPCGVPLIKAADLNGNVINPRPGFRISEDKHWEYRRTELSGGEIIMTLVGNVGQCAVVSNDMEGWNVARAVAVIRLKDPTDAHFVQQCLLSTPLRHLMDVWYNTTVQATLNLKDIRKLPLPWPPKEQRDQIAAIGRVFNAKIELNRRMNETLEAMARALFKSWFVDFDPVRAKAEGRDPGLPKPIADLFPDEFQDSELGPIPKGWEVGTLPDVVEINPTRHLSKGVVAPYLDMASMPTKGPSPESWVMREMGSGMKFINGDTLVARITPCLENGKSAYVDFLRDGEIGWGSTEYIVLRPKGIIPPLFAYLLARTDDFRTFAIQQMTGSSGRQRVPPTSLEKYGVVIPCIDSPIFTCFGRAVTPLFARINVGMAQSRSMSALRDILLPELISGELSTAT